MALVTTQKKEIIESYKTHNQDTGSAQVQIALLTERINLLTDHFKDHKKDYNSRRGLLMLVGKRRRLLNYLKKKDIGMYQGLLDKLKLRK